MARRGLEGSDQPLGLGPYGGHEGLVGLHEERVPQREDDHPVGVPLGDQRAREDHLGCMPQRVRQVYAAERDGHQTSAHVRREVQVRHLWRAQLPHLCLEEQAQLGEHVVTIPERRPLRAHDGIRHARAARLLVQGDQGAQRAGSRGVHGADIIRVRAAGASCVLARLRPPASEGQCRDRHRHRQPDEELVDDGGLERARERHRQAE